MAGTLKCTKISIGDPKSANPVKAWVRADYVETTTIPPTPGSVSVLTDLTDCEDPALLQSAIDNQLALLGGATMDWTL